MSESLSSDNDADGTTKSRRVRMLQAYNRAIEDMEHSYDHSDSSDIFEDESGTASPNSSFTPKRPKLQRHRTISEAMESLVHVDEDMAPYKLLNFLFHASVAGTLPYFTLYSKQLGLDAAQIGMVCGLRPALSSIATPVVGWFSDRYHLRRTCAILCSLFWIFLTLFIAVVPPPEIAKCDIVIGRLVERLPAHHELRDLQCKISHNPNIPSDTFSRHLFLQKLILPNATAATLIDDCNDETNTSSKVIIPPNDLNETNPGVGDGRYQTLNLKDRDLVMEFRGIVDGGSENDPVKQKVENGSWLYNTVSLRDAFISAFILAAFATMMQVMLICEVIKQNE